MEPNEQDAGVFDIIATEEHQAPAKPSEPVKTETSEPEAKTAKEPKQTKTESVEEPVADDENGNDTQDFSRKDVPAIETEAEPETTEPSQTEKQTQAEPVEDNWKDNLPPPPAPFALPAPEINELGQITNYTPDQYQRYLIESSKAEMRQEMYVQTVENRALDAAEQLLPEIKTNKLVRQLVENARVASIINGQQIDAYEAAKQVKEALGITSTKIAEAKAEGANGAKVQITVQKNAAVETKGPSQTKPKANAVDKLSKRLKQGDDEAFVELFDLWDKDGKI